MKRFPSSANKVEEERQKWEAKLAASEHELIFRRANRDLQKRVAECGLIKVTCSSSRNAAY